MPKKAPNTLRMDPTRTGMIRRRFEQTVVHLFENLKKKIRRVVVDEDAFGLAKPYTMRLRGMPNIVINEKVLLNSRWEFKTTQQQLDEFMNWLATQLTTEILAIQFNDIESTYFGEFIRQSYEKGVGRVFDELRGQPILTQGSVRSFYNGTKEEFLRSTFAQPVSIDRVKALASRTFTELKNVTSAMGAEMSRTLADGLAQGKSPYDVGRDLSRAIDGIGKKRATMIARTETIRAHATGQLDSMERLGVPEVGVMVEWSVARDSRLCPRCSALAGIVLTLKEARGLLPAHPNCRCSFIPANVGEDSSKQKRSRDSIKAAMKKSILAEAGKNKKGRTYSQIKARSKWAGADREIAKKRPKSILED